MRTEAVGTHFAMVHPLSKLKGGLPPVHAPFGSPGHSDERKLPRAFATHKPGCFPWAHPELWRALCVPAALVGLLSPLSRCLSPHTTVPWQDLPEDGRGFSWRKPAASGLPVCALVSWGTGTAQLLSARDPRTSQRKAFQGIFYGERGGCGTLGRPLALSAFCSVAPSGRPHVVSVCCSAGREWLPGLPWVALSRPFAVRRCHRARSAYVCE